LTATDAGLVGQAAAGALTAQCLATSGDAGVALLEFYDVAAAPSATSSRVVNFSGRARVEGGAGLMVVGFVVAGEGEIRLLLRGVGPALTQLGVTGVLDDPIIELFSGDAVVAANDSWQSGDPAFAAQIANAAQAAGAFALASTKEAALLVTLRAGAYTLQVRGAAGQTGVALAEIYEVAPTEFDAATSTNAVGLDLYRQLATPAGTNLVLSPYSIESALGLAYAGAAGDTRSEMARVLRFPAGNTELQAGFAALRNALAQTAENATQTAAARTRAGRRTDPLEWNAANRLFGQQGFAFRDSFLTLMADGFAAPLQALDFRGATEPSRLAINGWVEEQTRQKIRNLIPSGGVSALTRLVLVNALYLKAPWDTPFEKFATQPREFRLATGASANVPTMQRTAQMGYSASDGVTVVTLDYLDGGLQFVIVLPDEGQTIEAAAARLTPEHFARWARLPDGGRRLVALYLPKFKVEGATVPLGATLRALGMKSAFDIPPGSANFDGIAPRLTTEPLAISDVFHQTFIALDEDGTEAAAATAVVIGPTSVPINPVPPLEVRVDRPFLFAIQHRASGACLFLGRIADPR
jgi:serpin B